MRELHKQLIGERRDLKNLEKCNVAAIITPGD